MDNVTVVVVVVVVVVIAAYVAIASMTAVPVIVVIVVNVVTIINKSSNVAYDAWEFISDDVTRTNTCIQSGCNSSQHWERKGRGGSSIRSSTKGI